MNPTYTATGTTINKQSVMLIEPTPLQQLSTLLDQLALPKTAFQYGIKMADTRQHIMYISKGRSGYTACISVGTDNIMRTLDRLSEEDLESVIKRVKVDYKNKIK